MQISWLHRSRLAPRASFLLVATVLAAMTLSGCGFKLRGQADLPFESICVETSGFSLFAAELRRVIQTGSKTRVTDNPSDAEVVLKVLGEAQEKQILSISGTGKVREFELRYRVSYRITDRALKDVVPPNVIVLRRDMTYDDTQVLAKESEEQLLYQDMQTDAVQQMLRRLSDLKLQS